jgi:hypothetical protein
MPLLSTHISLRTILAHSKAQMANIIIQTRPSPVMQAHTTLTRFLTYQLRAGRRIVKVLQFRQPHLQLKADIVNMSKSLKDMLTKMIC